MAENKKSLVVVMGLMSRLRNSKKKDKIIDSIENMLIEEGVCSIDDVRSMEQRYNGFVELLSAELSLGMSYNDAYIKASYEYPEFKINPN